jgi:hypothetical protein
VSSYLPLTMSTSWAVWWGNHRTVSSTCACLAGTEDLGLLVRAKGEVSRVSALWE